MTLQPYVRLEIRPEENLLNNFSHHLVKHEWYTVQ